jgi:myo-inositol-1(or 4)-monophosphatase
VTDRYRDVAITTAKRAGKLLLEWGAGRRAVTLKGAIDLVTEADRRSEAAITEAIAGAFPDHSIIAEEGTLVKGTAPYRWIIDPLDGTTNFAHGFPVFCVAIGLEAEGEMVMGVAYDPTREELFVAQRGRGAFLNGRPLKVSPTQSLNESLLATGFSYDIREHPRNNLPEYSAFTLRCRGVRRMGSAILDLAYVAAGRLDGYWEMRLGPWDMAAGVVMVEEAGGRVTSIDGGPFDLSRGEVLASNGKIHQEMMTVLTEVQRR